MARVGIRDITDSRWGFLDNKVVLKMATNNVIANLALIRQWGVSKGFVKKENSHTQLCKLLEEAGELSSAVLKHKEDEIKDGIGDCVVVLTLLAEMQGLHIEDCIEAAYNEIKNRTGNVINGTFIKNEK